MLKRSLAAVAGLALSLSIATTHAAENPAGFCHS